ncbi:signal transduction response regulator [Sulfurimonas gotlandica GD1]|uniref:Signal transduction response regulator n=1 Tax=Sulfurimonas gotlandica (strain DSM 19862 / JCM 16533 / GD1) TaxID=929558 RepID=B6BNU7_SULGG|nr:response regulator [Sulfurimonas gotlandica]EDZ61207.1 putative chemotaxis protein [Sulfurimonas gotlandica GD1]EHP28901.1 signal transduction response regulator [Sulfurimonas gotlandica GD1]
MKILIVDDNVNNRMILKLLLEDYGEDHNTKFIIDEASDGLEAVQKSKDNAFDIILMDIMMPNMDGIEATKIIRETNLSVMIIAVSAVDDSDRKKEILNIGAEDYISKPVNADIFTSRIESYITLIEARGHEKINTRTMNIFTNEIYSRHTNFIIKSEDSLSEFWEFFLLSATKKNESLSDVVRTIFSIAELQVKLSIESGIYIEESDKYQYFTLTRIDKLPKNLAELILKKNKLECKYKIDNTKISFELSKVYEKDEIELHKKPAVTPVVIENVDDLIASPVEYVSQELVVFDYIDGDDLYDLEEYSTKLASLMLVVGSGDITEDEVVAIYGYLEKLGSILSTYGEVYVISKALTALAYDMSEHSKEFIENSSDLGAMCKAFSNDMSTWIQMSFHRGAPSADFMNDTIVVNCETISGMLKMNDNTNESLDDLDDIFDF